MRTNGWYAASLLLSITLSLGPLWFDHSTAAATEDNEFSLETLTRQYHWILYVDVERLNDYLKYPRSTLNPLDRFIVSYQQTAAAFILRETSSPSYTPFKYEEFWYHDAKPIGFRRYKDVPMPMHDQGAIFFRFPADSSGMFNSPEATANCAMRLLVEASVRRSIVAAIIVPQMFFERVSTALGNFGFYPVGASLAGQGAQSTVRLISYPKGLERYFYLDSSKAQ